MTGIREPDHDRYRFHITLAYQVAPLTPQEDDAWRRSLAAWKVMIARRAPIITLGNPEYLPAEGHVRLQASVLPVMMRRALPCWR